MFDSIWQDIKSEFRIGNMITRLIIINVFVFVFVNLVKLFITLGSGFKPPDGTQTPFEKFISWFALSSDWVYDLTHPWVWFTSMFLHVGFLHILFNMLFLYWFGRIVGDLIGDKKILPLYILGGLTGAFVFVGLSQAFDIGNPAYGASAGVMAIVVASGLLAPDFIIRLLFLGEVKLKYIVMVILFLDLMGIGSMSNTGGHFAHLGGALMGWFFIYNLKNGTDLGEPINKMNDSVTGFFRKQKMTVAYKNENKARSRRNQKPHAVSDDDQSYEEQLDAILDKIKQKGRSSLTREEEAFLEKASNKK